MDSVPADFEEKVGGTEQGAEGIGVYRGVTGTNGPSSDSGMSMFMSEEGRETQGMNPGASMTNWGMIHEAAEGDTAEGAAAREKLLRRYWPAVYAYLRKSGRSVHEASDLTQAFFCEVVLTRELFGKADQGRGRFRTLLLTALKNYARERHRYDTAKRRAPEGRPPIPFSPHDLEEMEQGEGGDRGSPEEAFTAHWSAALVRQVLEGVRHQCRVKGLDTHWAIFEARIVNPLMWGTAALPYEDLVRRFDLNDRAQASNLMTTVKRRFARALRRAVAETMVTMEGQAVDDELGELLRIMERRR